MILPSFTLYHTANICFLPSTTTQYNTMASHKELSRLATDMTITASSGRPSRNSQGIHSTLLNPARPTTLLSDALGTPVNFELTRSILPDNRNHTASDTPITLITASVQDRQVEALTPCMRQHDRFVDPSCKPLQPGTVIVCDDLPFVVSSNGKIYNFTGGNMKQLYITEPSEQKFLVKATNSPSTFSNILGSVLGLLPRFRKRQSQIDNHKNKDQEQTSAKASTIKMIHTISSGNVTELGNNVDTISEGNVSDLTNFCTHKSAHHNMQDAAPYQENLFPNHAQNEMLSPYNRIGIGCFKDIFQSVNMNNLAKILQALKELNFMLANRAPELAAHYNMPLEPQ